MELDRNASILPNERAEAKLIHIGEDGWSFLVEENSFGDMWAFKNDKKFEKYEDEYVWYVDVTMSNIN